jgi:hypothetical protein
VYPLEQWEYTKAYSWVTEVIQQLEFPIAFDPDGGSATADPRHGDQEKFD